MSRALQLYPNLKERKLFNAYRYYYHTSLAEENLHAAVEMKKNYIRIAKGRAQRKGLSTHLIFIPIQIVYVQTNRTNN